MSQEALAHVPAPRAKHSCLISIPNQKHQCFMEGLQESTALQLPDTAHAVWASCLLPDILTNSGAILHLDC